MLGSGCRAAIAPSYALGPYADLDPDGLDRVASELARLGYEQIVVDAEAGTVGAAMMRCATRGQRPSLVVRAFRQGWLDVAIASYGDARCGRRGAGDGPLRHELMGVATSLRARLVTSGAEEEGDPELAGTESWASAAHAPSAVINPTVASAPIAELVGVSAVAFALGHVGSAAVGFGLLDEEPCASGSAGWFFAPWLGGVIGAAQIQCAETMPTAAFSLFGRYEGFQIIGVLTAVVQLAATTLFALGIGNHAVRPTRADAPRRALAFDPFALTVAF